jgi:hypothetical protein
MRSSCLVAAFPLQVKVNSGKSSTLRVTAFKANIKVQISGKGKLRVAAIRAKVKVSMLVAAFKAKVAMPHRRKLTGLGAAAAAAMAMALGSSVGARKVECHTRISCSSSSRT